MGRGVPAAAGSRGRSAPVPQLARPPAVTVTGAHCMPARGRVFSVHIVGFFPVWTFGPRVRVYVLNGSGCPTCVCHRLSFSQYSNSFSSFHFPDDTEQCFLWETCRTGRHVERQGKAAPKPARRPRGPCASALCPSRGGGHPEPGRLVWARLCRPRAAAPSQRVPPPGRSKWPCFAKRSGRGLGSDSPLVRKPFGGSAPIAGLTETCKESAFFNRPIFLMAKTVLSSFFRF